jgi:MinD-like ATPase involved in chromosome partitioning or flagellar assembly
MTGGDDDYGADETMLVAAHPPSDDDPTSAVAGTSARASITAHVEALHPGLPVTTGPVRRDTVTRHLPPDRPRAAAPKARRDGPPSQPPPGAQPPAAREAAPTAEVPRPPDPAEPESPPTEPLETIGGAAPAGPDGTASTVSPSTARSPQRPAPSTHSIDRPPAAPRIGQQTRARPPLAPASEPGAAVLPPGWLPGTRLPPGVPFPPPLAPDEHQEMLRGMPAPSAAVPPATPPALLREPPATSRPAGWRRAVSSATFGLIEPGPSAWERREAELREAIAVPLWRPYKIAVVGRGGAGKTTLCACVGSLLAEVRRDLVVAVDADTAFGELGSRVDPSPVESFWELAYCQRPRQFADMRTRVGVNAAGLFVLPGESATSQRRVLDAEVYRRAVERLDDHFVLAVIDCSSTMDTAVTHEALVSADAVVVVTPPWSDGASVAGQTLDWLGQRGYVEQLRRAVIVVNDSDGHAAKSTKSRVAEVFSNLGHPVFELPFDSGLRSGGLIDVADGISAPTRRALFEMTAGLSRGFPAARNGTNHW